MTPTLTCSSSVTVLMIDDNPEDLEYWSKLLRVSSSNYSILKAQRVRAGLDLCQYQKIDCIIVDLDMGDSLGFEVLLTLIPDRKRPEIAVVVLTRLRNPSLHETVLYHGAQAYLVKQLTSADELDKAIQKAVTSVASKLNERPPKDCG